MALCNFYPGLVSTYSAGQVFTITVQISWSGSPITDFKERAYSIFGSTVSIKNANGQKVTKNYDRNSLSSFKN
jgi:hypothetical protein